MTKLSEVLSKNRSLKQAVTSTLIAGYNRSDNELIVMELGENGAIITTDYPHAYFKVSGLATVAVKNDIETLINFTASSDIIVDRFVLTGNGYGEFRIEVNGQRWAVLQNSYFQRTVNLEIPLKLESGDTVEVAVKNDTIEAESNDYESFFYYRSAS